MSISSFIKSINVLFHKNSFIHITGIYQVNLKKSHHDLCTLRIISCNRPRHFFMMFISKQLLTKTKNKIKWKNRIVTLQVKLQNCRKHYTFISKFYYFIFTQLVSCCFLEWHLDKGLAQIWKILLFWAVSSYLQEKL